MVLRLTLLPLATALAIALSPSTATADPRTVFARHDPIRRLPHTAIRKLGSLRIKRSRFSFYYLEFVNPVSHHGQQRIAIIKNGKTFAGAYQCTLGRRDGKLIIGKDRLTLREEGQTFVMRFNEHGPSHNKHFCGESSGWENSI